MFEEHAGHLQAYLNQTRVENTRLRQDLDATRRQLASALAEVARVNRQLAELRSTLVATPTESPAIPAFVKPGVPVRKRKKSGRKVGHVAALRPMPAKIDRGWWRCRWRRTTRAGNSVRGAGAC
jgi:hypothetical protein